MIYGLVIVVHIVVSLVLIGVVLLQGGRGGLAEALGGAAAQSLFGSRAANVLTRITTFCAGMFVVTCLSLAYLSTVRGRSVVEQIPAVTPETLPMFPPAPPTPQEPHTPEAPAATPREATPSP